MTATATARRMANETRVSRLGIHVTRTRICGGGEWYCYSAWVPSSLMGNHSTIMRIYSETEPDNYYGRVGTERLPKELDILPAMTEQRLTAVRAWQQDRYQNAYRAIVECFPEAAEGKQRMGEIDLVRG